MKAASWFLVLVLAMSTARAAVKAWVDSSEVAADGSIQLTLEHDGQIDPDPDLAPLKRDFDVLSSTRSSSIQIVNGSVASNVQVQITLSPKHGGAITIPALTWGNEQSDPITVKFGGAAAPNAAGGTANGASPGAPDPGAPQAKESVFIETSVDSKQPYVQSGVRLTVRIYSSVPLRHAVLDMPSSNDAVIQQVGSDRRDFEVKDGQRYQVVERHYEVFPQHSGEVALPVPVLDGQIPVRERSDPFTDRFKGIFSDSILNNMLTALKPIRVRGDALTLNVMPRPKDAADTWLPARSVTLQAEWQPGDAAPKVGDPVSWHLHLEAQGLMAAQLPDLNALIKLPPGLKAYPDQPRLDNDTHGDTVVGARDQTIAFIADQPGQYIVPSLTLHWWDIEAKQTREITVPGRTFTIVPAVGAVQAAGQPADTTAGAASAPTAQASTATAPPAPADAGASRPDSSNTRASSPAWRWISALFGLLWIVTLVGWYLSTRSAAHRRAPAGVDEGSTLSAAQVRTAFHEACKRDDPRAARANLVRWLHMTRPQSRSNGLRSLAAESGDTALAALLVDLDRACFGAGDWSGAALLAALPDLPSVTVLPPERAPVLASLYR